MTRFYQLDLSQDIDSPFLKQKNRRKGVFTIEESIMLGRHAVDAQLSRSLGLTMKEIEPILAVGGDSAEKKFMECCWCLWKADGIELVEPFIDAAFNILPEKSRSLLFQRMLTIVYVAQDAKSKRLIQSPPEIRQFIKKVADAKLPRSIIKHTVDDFQLKDIFTRAEALVAKANPTFAKTVSKDTIPMETSPNDTFPEKSPSKKAGLKKTPSKEARLKKTPSEKAQSKKKSKRSVKRGVRTLS